MSDGRYTVPMGAPARRASQPDIDDHGERLALLEAIVGEPPAPALGKPGRGMALVLTQVQTAVGEIKEGVAELRNARAEMVAPWKRVGWIVAAGFLGALGMAIFHWVVTMHH